MIGGLNLKVQVLFQTWTQAEQNDVLSETVILRAKFTITSGQKEVFKSTLNSLDVKNK